MRMVHVSCSTIYAVGLASIMNLLRTTYYSGGTDAMISPILTSLGASMVPSTSSVLLRGFSITRHFQAVSKTPPQYTGFLGSDLTA